MDSYSSGFIMIVFIIMGFIIAAVAMIKSVDADNEVRSRMDNFSAEEILAFASRYRNVPYDKLPEKSQRLWNAFYYANDVFKSQASFEDLTDDQKLNLVQWCVDNLESISDFGIEYIVEQYSVRSNVLSINGQLTQVKHAVPISLGKNKIIFRFRDDDTAVRFKLSWDGQ